MTTPHVAVVILTRDRPDGCRRVVDGVLGQDVPEDWQFDVVVVDNNVMPMAHDWDDQRVHVVRGPDGGIPAGRNRGVQEALSLGAGAVVFIDDDEEPAVATWLRTLVDPILAGSCDIATGPVQCAFPTGTPEAITSHPLFNRGHRSEVVDKRIDIYTGNTAIAYVVFADLASWFDTAFSRTGGSDTEFFRRARDRGFRACWRSEAGVTEFVDADRATVRWILRRSLRIGANRVQFLRREGATIGRWCVVTLSSLVELLAAAAFIAWPLNPRSCLAVGSRGWRAAGFFWAAFGREVFVYEGGASAH